MATEKSDSNQWFLRIANGTVFGPVSTKGLIVWAEQGRIVPGNEVSNDRETWIPAETVTELEMNWYVNAGSKTEGPFNRTAAESFLKSGKAPSGAKLINAKEVDPAVLVLHDTAETLETNPAEPKAPAAGRHATVKPSEPGNETDARHGAEPDAAPEKQREPLSRQAAKAHAAVEDERNYLRRQVQELQQSCDALRKDLAGAQSENETLRANDTRNGRQVADLASQVGQLETECRKLADEREKLQRQLGVAMSEATDATNEAANGELRHRVEQLEAVNEGLRAQLAQADQALAAEHAALAELLASSNTRDLSSRQRIEAIEQHQTELEHQLQELGTASEREAKLSAEVAAARTRIAELQGRLARTPEASAARAPEAEAWLRQFATDELTTLDKALHEERQSFNGFRELSAARQEAIQTRIQAIQRLLSGDYPDGRRATTPSQRISGLDQSRLQSEVDSMRESQQKETRQFEERQNELLRRIRVLETEEARLRSLQEATDMEGGRKFELMETVRRREQELAQERRNHDQDREQFDSARQALQRRIEELERAAGIPSEPRPGSDVPGNPAAAKNRRLAGFGTWLKR